MHPVARTVLVATALLAAPAHVAHAEEGMWLPNALPAAALKAKHGFEASPALLERLQKSCVRFSTGGSGSIVSADGLVMTNHHVGSDMLAKLSTPERDLLATGFLAKDRGEELRCPDLELNALWSIEDVTDRVVAAGKDAKDTAAAGEARRREITRIEDESEKATGLKSQVVTLWQGGRYHLYRYRTWRDVRLVFAPETAIAFFGGDADNFEFPRYDLDCCFFRIYEDGKPMKPEHFLAWDADGAKEGELVFTWGHPGSTNRLYTADHVAFMRDVEEPMGLRRLWRNEVKLATFMGRGAEEARIAREDFFGTQNGRKSSQGLLDALQDPALVAAKRAEEAALAKRLAGKPEAKDYEDGRRLVRESLAASKRLAPDYLALERRMRGGALAGIARTLVRMKAEDAKPSAERLPEFADANRQTLESRLYSPAPIYPQLEIERMASMLSGLAEERGLDDRLVAKVLAGKSPRARATELVRGTKLADVAARRAPDPADPMMAFMASIDPEARAARKAWEDEVDAPQELGYGKIAAARFAAFGDSVYPDATFTLRMSYGTVKGWTAADGTEVPAFTTIAGTFDRAKARAGDPAFELPASWLAAKERLDGTVPFNFVSTNDIIGGNSGSPIVDVDGEVVGLIFDGNLDSLAGVVVYDMARTRATSVDARAIVESMRKVYGATALAEELTALGTGK
ncbi:MAG: S46 family peptidase [Phycisphaerales bacterium]